MKLRNKTYGLSEKLNQGKTIRIKTNFRKHRLTVLDLQESRIYRYTHKQSTPYFVTKFKTQ